MCSTTARVLLSDGIMIWTYNPEACFTVHLFFPSGVKTKETFVDFRESRLREQGHARRLHHLYAHVTRYLDAVSHLRGPECDECDVHFLWDLHNDFSLSGVLASDTECSPMVKKRDPVVRAAA